jgi:uncharacterized protein YcbK (DUF882 family)
MIKCKFSVFDSKHNTGEYSKLSQDLIKYVNQLSDYLNDMYGYTEIIITSGYREKDNSSQHREGKAFDIMCLNDKIRLIDFYLAAERFPFTGIGVYPDWKARDKVYGGIHVDVRSLEDNKGARWFGVRNMLTGKNDYLGLTSDNLRKYGII